MNPRKLYGITVNFDKSEGGWSAYWTLGDCSEATNLTAHKHVVIELAKEGVKAMLARMLNVKPTDLYKVSHGCPVLVVRRSGLKHQPVYIWNDQVWICSICDGFSEAVYEGTCALERKRYVEVFDTVKCFAVEASASVADAYQARGEPVPDRYKDLQEIALALAYQKYGLPKGMSFESIRHTIRKTFQRP